LLKEIGISEIESRVYLHLLKKSPAKASQISQALRISRVQLYRILKNLQRKGLVESSLEYPALFTAVPFKRLIDFLINAKKEEARNLEASKKDIVSQLDVYQPDSCELGSNKFMVLEGRGLIYSKITQMIQETKKTLFVVTSGTGVIEAYRSGLLEYGFNHPRRKEVHFRFLTSFSTIANNIEFTREMLKRAETNSLCLESRIITFGAELFPRFLIRDEDEVVVFLRPTKSNDSTDKNDAGLWTNNQVLVHAFMAFFEAMWRNSADIKERVTDP
jgi:sugar-specific transcriptional regulator TrmB